MADKDLSGARSAHHDSARDAEDALDRLLAAWREDIDSEPFPVITDVAMPRQTRRRMSRDVPEQPR